MLVCRAARPLSRQTLAFVSTLICAHRKQMGSVWRALDPGRRALLVLVYLRKGEPFAEVGAGFAGVGAGRPFYSGKHQRHGVSLQVIASLDGAILWVSGRLPGSTRDTAAAGIWNILAALRDAGLIAWGDEGYHGCDESGQRVRIPCTGREEPESR